jgi:hypothetical protein
MEIGGMNEDYCSGKIGQDARMPAGWWVPIGIFCVLVFASGAWFGAVFF